MNLVFDWSGTLADDERLTFELTRDCISHFGGPTIDWDAYRAEFTIPVDGFYAKYNPGVDIAEIDRWFFDAYAQRIAAVTLFDGIEPLLRELAESHRLFVLSTLRTDLIERALEARGLLDAFDEVCGDAFDKREHLPGLLKRHGLIPFETLFVGDARHDIASGHHAGVQTGAVTWGYTDGDELLEERPDHVFHGVQELVGHMTGEVLLDRGDAPVSTVGGLVFRDDDRALFIKTEKWSGLWGTPGGKLKFGEPMTEGFVREVLEETGLEATDVRFAIAQEAICHPQFYKPRHFVLLNFVARTSGGDVALNYESTESRWATLAEARDLDLNEPTRRLVDHLVAHPEIMS